MKKHSKKLAAKEPAEAVSTLVIPDDLLAWGREPSRAITFTHDWSREIDSIIAAANGEPISWRELDRLLCRVEGLCYDAKLAGRSDLLLGFDLYSAELLYLTLHADTPHGKLHVGLGERGAWTWSEVRAVIAGAAAARKRRSVGIYAPDPVGAAALAWKARELIADTFPDARINRVTIDEDKACAACNRPLDTAMSMQVGSQLQHADAAETSDTEWCAECWLNLATRMPEHIRKIAAKASKGKRR